jgi:hypothetical protein
LEEDIPILDFKLKIKSRLSKERLYSKIETELNGMYERLKNYKKQLFVSR